MPNTDIYAIQVKRICGSYTIKEVSVIEFTSVMS